MASKKPERGTLYRTDGQVILLKPEDGKNFTLSELQSAVGGYIEPVIPLNKQSKLYVNEEGILNHLPLNGHFRTIVDVSKYYKNFYIVGDAISTYRVNPGEENDEGRMLVRDAVSIKESK